MASYKTKIITVLISSAIILHPLFGQEAASNYLGETSFQPSPVKESADAIFGRILGVQDDKLDIDYYVFELTNHTPGNALFRSALIPGWGQAFNGESTKGAVIFSVFAAATAGSIFLYDSAKDKYDDYKDVGEKDSSKYDDYENLRTQSYLLGGVAVGLWIFGMADAYRHAYSPLWSKNSGFEFAYLPTRGDPLQAEISWKKRF